MHTHIFGGLVAFNPVVGGHRHHAAAKTLSKPFIKMPPLRRNIPTAFRCPHTASTSGRAMGKSQPGEVIRQQMIWHQKSTTEFSLGVRGMSECSTDQSTVVKP